METQIRSSERSRHIRNQGARSRWRASPWGGLPNRAVGSKWVFACFKLEPFGRVCGAEGESQACEVSGGDGGPTWARRLLQTASGPQAGRPEEVARAQKRSIGIPTRRVAGLRHPNPTRLPITPHFPALRKRGPSAHYAITPCLRPKIPIILITRPIISVALRVGIRRIGKVILSFKTGVEFFGWANRRHNARWRIK